MGGEDAAGDRGAPSPDAAAPQVRRRADAEVLLNGHRTAGRQLLAGLCGVTEDVLARGVALLGAGGQPRAGGSVARRRAIPAGAGSRLVTCGFTGAGAGF
jgi:hypothetical protein